MEQETYVFLTDKIGLCAIRRESDGRYFDYDEKMEDDGDSIFWHEEGEDFFDACWMPREKAELWFSRLTAYQNRPKLSTNLTHDTITNHTATSPITKAGV